MINRDYVIVIHCLSIMSVVIKFYRNYCTLYLFIDIFYVTIKISEYSTINFFLYIKHNYLFNFGKFHRYVWYYIMNMGSKFCGHVFMVLIKLDSPVLLNTFFKCLDSNFSIMQCIIIMYYYYYYYYC